MRACENDRVSRSIPCKGCGAELGPTSRRKAFFAKFVHGDEEVRSWFHCDTCHNWTIEYLDDRFMGDTTITVTGPFPEGSCEADIALARTCPDPGNKWCDCPAHRQMEH